MVEWCWINGKVMPLAEATVNVEDRGFQFADGVYEAVRLYGGKPFMLDLHMERLLRSCEGIRLKLPLAKFTLVSELLKLVAHSGIKDGWVYLQVTRGPAPRNHIYPAAPSPTVLFYVRALEPLPPAERVRPYALLSVLDDRWNKCWIKAIALLPNVLAKNAAADAGCDEAIFIHNGNVTEGSASNLFMVQSGRLITHPAGEKVLPGVTRDVLLDCAKTLGIPVEERPMPLEEARRANEVFITSSTRELVWVNRWDNQQIADGRCGPICCKLHEEYRKRVNQMRDER
jgi:D-alanine transaminase